MWYNLLKAFNFRLLNRKHSKNGFFKRTDKYCADVTLFSMSSYKGRDAYMYRL